MENIHNHVNFILDEFAPFRKLNKREIKLKSKPWISKDILFLMWERDKIFSKYHKCKYPLNKSNLFSQYKLIRNEVTKLKRDNKIKYYKEFFEINNKKTSAIWKGIRSLVTIKPSNLNQLTIEWAISINYTNLLWSTYEIQDTNNIYITEITMHAI